MLATLLLFTGCSQFNRDYKAALEQPLPADTPEGPWVGRWLSDKNGHNGELRCLIERNTNEIYTARFKARFWKIFTYTSEAELTMQSETTQRTFAGDAELSWLAGGRYTYDGRVDATNFFSTYECKWDHGTFEMTRPKPEAENSE